MKKKQLNSPQDAELLDSFRNKCVEQNISQAEIIKELLTAYVNDEINFEKKMVYNVRRKDN